MKPKSKYTQERHKKIRRKLIRIVVLIFVIIIAIMYGLFYAKFFDIREVTVQDTKGIDSQEVYDAAQQWFDTTTWGIARRSNSYVFGLGGLEDELKQAFPKIDQANVQRQTRHAITIEMVERKPSGIWCLHDICYYFDHTGIAYTEIAKSSGFLFPNINDDRQRSIQLGNVVAENTWLDDILLARKTLQFGGVGIREISIASDSQDTFTVTTNEGWDIYFNINTGISQQGQALVTFLRETVTRDERALLEYVDLTIQDRIYYKSVDGTQDESL